MQAEWIAVDWGTTHLRAFAMAGREVLAQASSDQGMNTLARSDFEAALLTLIADWLTTGRTTQVICCGMIGARQGWVEAPYRSVPCRAGGGAMIRAQASDPRVNVHVLPGISQANPSDVMRGEETQIAGFLALNEGWDGVICLPGTHSKWAHISAGEVISFQTFMTGELFALLTDQSVLRHSTSSAEWDNDAFSQAISDTLSRPESLAARLFRLRASDLLNATPSATARAQLSGFLIGAELAAARPYWLGQQVTVIGADSLAKTYIKALELQAIPATFAKASAMTLAGLTAAHRTLETTA
ncbi:MAG: 2-dehydro-3-deoxygalactonokinase [Aliishimia sp.]